MHETEARYPKFIQHFIGITDRGIDNKQSNILIVYNNKLALKKRVEDRTA